MQLHCRRVNVTIINTCGIRLSPVERTLWPHERVLKGVATIVLGLRATLRRSVPVPAQVPIPTVGVEVEAREKALIVADLPDQVGGEDDGIAERVCALEVALAKAVAAAQMLDPRVVVEVCVGGTAGFLV